MAQRKGQAARSKVIGVRVTPHEEAAVALLRGNQEAGPWVRALVLKELAEAKKDGRL